LALSTAASCLSLKGLADGTAADAGQEGACACEPGVAHEPTVAEPAMIVSLPTLNSLGPGAELRLLLADVSAEGAFPSFPDLRWRADTAALADVGAGFLCSTPALMADDSDDEGAFEVDDYYFAGAAWSTGADGPVAMETIVAPASQFGQSADAARPALRAARGPQSWRSNATRHALRAARAEVYGQSPCTPTTRPPASFAPRCERVPKDARKRPGALRNAIPALCRALFRS
jgi:hypothetical protein